MLRFALISLLILASSPALAQEPAGYDAAVASAVEEFGRGNWQEARALFRRAHQLYPNARTLRGLGMCAFELRQYVEALGKLQGAMDSKVRPLTESQRSQTKGLMDRARNFVGAFTVVLSPASAELVVNGTPVVPQAGKPMLLDMGQYELKVSAEGHAPTSRRIKVQGGESQTLELALEPSAAGAPVAAAATATAVAAPAPNEAPAGTKPADPAATASTSGGGSAWPWVTLAGTAAFLATGIAFKVVGDGRYSDLETSCSPNCSATQVEDSGVTTADNVMGASFIVAGVLAATTVTLFLLTGGEESAEVASTRLHLSPEGLSLGAKF